MDENELVMIADNESTNGHPKVPTDNNVYPMYEERGGTGDGRHAIICFDLPCVAGFTRSVSANLVIGASGGGVAPCRVQCMAWKDLKATLLQQQRPPPEDEVPVHIDVYCSNMLLHSSNRDKMDMRAINRKDLLVPFTPATAALHKSQRKLVAWRFPTGRLYAMHGNYAHMCKKVFEARIYCSTPQKHGVWQVLGHDAELCKTFIVQGRQRPDQLAGVKRARTAPEVPLDSNEKTLFDAIMKSIDDRGVPHLSKSCVLKVLSAVRQRVVQQCSKMQLPE